MSDQIIGENEFIRIGCYHLCAPYGGKPGTIAIYHEKSEGGDFSLADFEKAVAAFYRANF